MNFGKDITALRRCTRQTVCPGPPGMQNIPLRAGLAISAASGVVVAKPVNRGIPQRVKLANHPGLDRRNEVGFHFPQNYKPTPEVPGHKPRPMGNTALMLS